MVVILQCVQIFNRYFVQLKLMLYVVKDETVLPHFLKTEAGKVVSHCNEESLTFNCPQQIDLNGLNGKLMLENLIRYQENQTETSS